MFLGIGDIPDHVRIRLEQILQHIPNPAPVILVSRTISEAWDQLLGDHLADSQKLTIDTRLFLNRLVNAYVFEALRKLRDQVMLPEQLAMYSEAGIDFSRGVERLLRALEVVSGCVLLRWILAGRHHTWSTAVSVMHSPQVAQVLAALAVLASIQDPVVEHSDRPLHFEVAGNRRVSVDILLSAQMPSALALREARSRSAASVRRGTHGPSTEILLICEGQVGPMPHADSLPNVLTSSVDGDLLPDPDQGAAIVVDARSIIEGRLPRGFNP